MDGERWLQCYRKNFPAPNKIEQPDLKYKGFPEVTLDAFTESGRVESCIPVVLQRVYTRRRPVITSELADTPCAKLGVDGLLAKLNTILCTEKSCNLDTTVPSTLFYRLKKLLLDFIFSESVSEPHLSATSLYTLLEGYVNKGYDFGTAYAYLRPHWHSGMDARAVAKELEDRKRLDQEMRRDVLVDNKIINPQVPPRRVWDLYSNRVVPWWVARQRPQPISHAWMDKEDRDDVWTPINGLEWPVSTPKDTNLDLIRIEMVNMGAEYAWLDVLCLRQLGVRWTDDLRKKEWKVDVPTIGNVYHGVRVVCYLSGLGRPFSFKEDDFESDRSWFRRAWTLQEACVNPIIGGDMGDDGNMQEEVQRKFCDQMSTLETISRSHVLIELDNDVFNPLSHMQKRVPTSPVDKIAGLVYLLYSREIPAYYETQSDEDAWTALVNVMWSGIRAQLFFRYPEPGDSGKSWRPSWTQVMTGRLPLPDKGWWDEHVYRDEKMDADMYYGPCIESAFVQGLAKTLKKWEPRRGRFVVEQNHKDGRRTEHTFEIIADHDYPIPADSYTLLGIKSPFPGGDKAQYWVVGKRLPSDQKKFKKLSVFKFFDTKEFRRLNDLGITAMNPTFIV